MTAGTEQRSTHPERHYVHSLIMRAALLTLAFLPLLASAQPWCSPGAEWIYSFGNQQANGITRA